MEKIAREILDLKKKKAELEVEVSDVEKKLKENRQLLLEVMQERQIDKFSFGGYTFYPVHFWRGKIVNFPQFKDFLRVNGLLGMIKESVHHATLDSYISEQVKEGKEAPPGVEVSEFSTTQEKVAGKG
jgi:hypothetical protein